MIQWYFTLSPYCLLRIYIKRLNSSHLHMLCLWKSLCHFVCYCYTILFWTSLCLSISRSIFGKKNEPVIKRVADIDSDEDEEKVKKKVKTSTTKQSATDILTVSSLLYNTNTFRRHWNMIDVIMRKFSPEWSKSRNALCNVSTDAKLADLRKSILKIS